MFTKKKGLGMKRKKNVKMRGRTTHGWGHRKKHRGAGSRGGKGMAGSKKQNKFRTITSKPGHIGKRGFKSLGQRRIKPAVRAINLRDLGRLAKENEIDLAKLGYDKVLGAGELGRPLAIKARFFTKAAEEKIAEAGGKVVRYGAETEVSKILHASARDVHASLVQKHKKVS